MNIKRTNELTETVYTPESEMRNPLKMIKAMFADLLKSRGLAYQMLARDIKAQYRQSYFGILWAFLPPLATAGIFIVLNSKGFINIENTNIPYPAFAMIGTLLWQVFVDSLNAPLKVVNRSKALLVKINFPREAIIISGIGEVIFNLFIKLIILVIVFIVFKIPFSLGVILSILAILNIVLLGITIGVILTPLGILYTDILQALPVVTGLWFFITPVVYPPPQTFPFSLLATLNPISPLLTGARELATEGFIYNPLPYLVVTVLAIIALLISWILYRLSLPLIVERLGA